MHCKMLVQELATTRTHQTTHHALGTKVLAIPVSECIAQQSTLEETQVPVQHRNRLDM